MAPFTTALVIPLLTLPLLAPVFDPSLCDPHGTYQTYTQSVVDGPVFLSSIQCVPGAAGMFVYQPRQQLLNYKSYIIVAQDAPCPFPRHIQSQ